MLSFLHLLIFSLRNIAAVLTNLAGEPLGANTSRNNGVFGSWMDFFFSPCNWAKQCMDWGNRPVSEFFCQGNQLMAVTAKGQPLWKKCANDDSYSYSFKATGLRWAELSSIPGSTIFIIWTSPYVIICWEPGPSGSKIIADVTVDMSTTGDCCRQGWPTLWRSLMAVMASGNLHWSVFPSENAIYL